MTSTLSGVSQPHLLSVQQAALHLGVSVPYLAKLRSRGGGLPFVKIGTRVVYDPQDLAVFVSARRRTSTADVRKVA